MPERLSQEQIDSSLAGLAGWTQNGGEIGKQYTFKDFAAALAFVNEVGAAAEAADHHPDILLHGWNKVRITLSTHSAGGLTRNDFDLASKIDRMGG